MYVCKRPSSSNSHREQRKLAVSVGSGGITRACVPSSCSSRFGSPPSPVSSNLHEEEMNGQITPRRWRPGRALRRYVEPYGSTLRLGTNPVGSVSRSPECVGRLRKSATTLIVLKAPRLLLATANESGLSLCTTFG